jgi:hypothetical protein
MEEDNSSCSSDVSARQPLHATNDTSLSLVSVPDGIITSITVESSSQMASQDPSTYHHRLTQEEMAALIVAGAIDSLSGSWVEIRTPAGGMQVRIHATIAEMVKDLATAHGTISISYHVE